MKVLYVGLLSIMFLGVHAQKISKAFEELDTPTPPNYSDEFYWSALPWKVDSADNVPTNSYKNNQETAKVDVFYVHPTTINAKDNVWNADLQNEKFNNKIDKLPVKHQASVFNGSAKVYAPRYRQGNYECFLALENSSSQQALALAYSDVKAAFLYYLENWNNGRPFIIAGHSQGTFHAMELIKELIDTTDLLNQMVTAYLVGMPIQENKFENCKPCESEFSTNCFISWNTMKRKNYPEFYEEYFKGAVCHNPLSWELDGTYCEDVCHQGGVPANYNKFFKKRYGAEVRDNILWIDAVKLPGIPFTRFVKNWHIGDYNLFYGNIRYNLAVRIAEFLGNNSLEKTVGNF